jgi:hypothetical protein
VVSQVSKSRPGASGGKNEGALELENEIPDNERPAMEILGTILSWFVMLLVAGLFGWLIYSFLFKSGDSNQPMTARGIGIAMLAGVLKVIFLVLAERVSDVFDAGFFNIILILMVVVGSLMAIYGMTNS